MSIKPGFQRDEISGLAISRNQKHSNSDIVYVHNDGGNNSFAAYEANSGNFIQKFTLNNISVSDLEDIAIGPCGDNGGDCIYLADIGNNKARVKKPYGKKGKKKLKIFKFPEPKVNGSPETTSINNVETLKISYGPGSPTVTADAESIFIDPIGDNSGGKSGDIYIVTKWSDGQQHFSRIFRYPYVEQTTENVFALVALTDAYVKNLPMISRADISRDGSLIVIGTRSTTHFWRRHQGQTIMQSIEGGYCGNYSIDRSRHHQLEAIGFDPSNSYILEISECGDKGCDSFPDRGPLIGRREIGYK